MDYRGWYCTENANWKQIDDITVCASYSLSLFNLSPRLGRHFMAFNIPNYTDENLKAIFGCALTALLTGFNTSIQQLTDTITATIVDAFRRIATRFRPVPATCHYVFNVNDLGKCIHSLTRAEPNVYTQPLQFLRLLRHECDRVFCDRLASVEDKRDAQQIMKDVFAAHFDEPIVADIEQLLFADFVNITKNKEYKNYVEVRDVDKLKTVIADCLADMNKDFGRKEKLVLFQETIEHLLRIVRVLRITGGNGLIIGS